MACRADLSANLNRQILSTSVIPCSSGVFLFVPVSLRPKRRSTTADRPRPAWPLPRNGLRVPLPALRCYGLGAAGVADGATGDGDDHDHRRAGVAPPAEVSVSVDPSEADRSGDGAKHPVAASTARDLDSDRAAPGGFADADGTGGPLNPARSDSIVSGHGGIRRGCRLQSVDCKSRVV